MITSINPIDIRSGDVLVDSIHGDMNVNDTITAWDDAEWSSAMPGLVRLETGFGSLYLDNDRQVLVDRDE